jgi:hypothetical protein
MANVKNCRVLRDHEERRSIGYLCTSPTQNPLSVYVCLEDHVAHMSDRILHLFSYISPLAGLLIGIYLRLLAVTSANIKA